MIATDDRQAEDAEAMGAVVPLLVISAPSPN